MAVPENTMQVQEEEDDSFHHNNEISGIVKNYQTHSDKQKKCEGHLSLLIEKQTIS